MAFQYIPLDKAATLSTVNQVINASNGTLKFKKMKPNEVCQIQVEIEVRYNSVSDKVGLSNSFASTRIDTFDPRDVPTLPSVPLLDYYARPNTPSSLASTISPPSSPIIAPGYPKIRFEVDNDTPPQSPKAVIIPAAPIKLHRAN